MNFEKNKYTVLKQVISKDLAQFVYDYLLIKRNVLNTYIKYRHISPFNDMHGTFKDKMVPNTFSMYGDAVNDNLLLKLLPVVEKETKLKLLPTYSYSRIYKKEDVLKKHKDRFSCEISTTLNLGGDPWPIFIEPNIQIDLNQGDMLVYKGCELLHWRDKFEGENCGQVFLHYNEDTEKGRKNIYDGRIHLGLPANMKVYK